MQAEINLTRLYQDALSDSGFDEQDIRGFLGENFKRVAAQAWQP